MGYQIIRSDLRWLVPSRLLVNRLVEKLPANNWPPKPPVRVPRLPEVSRSPIVTDPVPLPCVKFVVTRNLPNCRSASYPSNVWFVKSPRISRLICVSRVPPSVPCKKPLKPTWSVSLKTRTCAPFTPNVPPSCRKTSNLQDVFVASVLKQQQKPVNHTFYAIFVLFLIFQLGMKKKNSTFQPLPFQTFCCTRHDLIPPTFDFNRL